MASGDVLSKDEAGPLAFVKRDKKYTWTYGHRAAMKWVLDFRYDHPVHCVVAPQSLMSFENVFTADRIKQLKDTIGKGFVGTYLGTINAVGVKESTEAFYILGIRILGVKELYNIVENEKIVGRDDLFKLNLENTFTKLSKTEFDLKKMIVLLHKAKSKHLVISMGNTLNLAEQGLCSDAPHPVHKAVTEYGKLKEKHQGNPFFHLVFNMLDRLGSLDRDAFKKKVAFYQEKELRDFVFMMLLSSFKVQSGESLKIPFEVTANTDVVVPDLICMPDYVKPAAASLSKEVTITNADYDIDDVSDESCLPLKNEVKLEVPTKSAQWWIDDMELLTGELMGLNLDTKTNLISTLLWQLFEQLLGHMIEENQREEDIPQSLPGCGRLFQSGVLIANDMAHVCVLTMDIDVFKRIKKLVLAKDTLEVLIDLAKECKSFCNLYYCTHIYHIGDAFSLIRGCSEYFSQFHHVEKNK